MRYLFLFVLTLSSFAGEAWEVKQANNFFTLEKDNISYPIVSDGGSPQFIKEKEFDPYDPEIAICKTLKEINSKEIYVQSKKKDEKKIKKWGSII